MIKNTESLQGYERGNDTRDTILSERLNLFVKLLTNSICVWKSLLNSNDSRQSLKSLGKLTIRNGTLIIGSSLRLVRLLINNYEHSRRTRHTACDSIQIVGLILMEARSHRYGLPAFPRQLDWQGFRYDQNVWEGAKKRCESFIYLLVVVC